jgi:thiol:disulfide interchange protein
MFGSKKKKCGPLPVLFMVLLSIVLLSIFFKQLKEGYTNEKKEEEDDELTDSVLQSSKPVLVLFYATWCRHCTDLHPIWNEAAKQANTEEKRMLKVNVGDNTPKQKKIMNQYKINGFPTIIIFKDGQHTTYEENHKSVDALLSTLQLDN